MLCDDEDEEVSNNQEEDSPPHDLTDKRLTQPQRHDISHATEMIESDEAPVRYKNLIEIYEACSFALTTADPASFEEAIED